MCEIRFGDSDLKSVEFTENDFSNMDEIARKLFYDEDDPRSPAYKRTLVRPSVHWGRISFFFILPFVLAAGLALALHFMHCKTYVSILSAIAVLLIYLILISKRLVICVIKIYQRYAPDAVRNKCRFEPSCSEYMLLAIDKYGFLKGFRKGIDRLKRCNVNGGGIDFP